MTCLMNSSETPVDTNNSEMDPYPDSTSAGVDITGSGIQIEFNGGDFEPHVRAIKVQSQLNQQMEFKVRKVIGVSF